MKNGPAKPVRCAIYTRVSTDHGLEQDFNSLDALPPIAIQSDQYRHQNTPNKLTLYGAGIMVLLIFAWSHA